MTQPTKILSGLGPSIKYVTLFLAKFDPLPLSHFVTHPTTPKSTSHISDPPSLVGLAQETRTKPHVQIISQLFAGVFVHGGLSEGLLSGRFCPGWSLPVPSYVRIHLLQQKAT